MHEDQGMSRIPVDPEAIRALAALLVETGLSEIELAERDSRIRVVRAAPVVVAAPPAALALIPPRTSPTPCRRRPSRRPTTPQHPGAVTSPMVGVVYLAPEPGAPVFVSVGQSVVAGQTLLLIEAMKTFNQIRAPRAGTGARILVSSGAPVEYGEALMILE